jgi:hypothetical protein
MLFHDKIFRFSLALRNSFSIYIETVSTTLKFVKDIINIHSRVSTG